METLYFAENLKEFRRNLKMSQKELARLLDVDQRTVSNWENKICEPNFEMLGKLCEIFDKSIEEFLT